MATNLTEKLEYFPLAQCPPTRQRDLILAHAQITTASDALKNCAQRQVDHTDHRLGPAGAHFLLENADDLIKLAVGHRVAFARGAEKIEMLCPLEHGAHLLAEYFP